MGTDFASATTYSPPWSPRGNRRYAMRLALRTPHRLEHDCIKYCQALRHGPRAYWGSGIRLVRCLFSFFGGICALVFVRLHGLIRKPAPADSVFKER